MPNRELLERARMFEERAERATDPISREHYREMAAHYRAPSIEQTAMQEPETAHRAFAFLVVVVHDDSDRRGRHHTSHGRSA
jgi:hypothetical protein